MKVRIKHEIKKTINKVIREEGHFPTIQDMCNVLGFSADQVIKYMEALSEDGYIEKVGRWYRYPIDNEQEDEEMNVKITDDIEKPYKDKVEFWKNKLNITGKDINITKKDIDEAIEIMSIPKKQKGRPPGSKNKKNDIPIQKINDEEKKILYGMPIYIIQFVMGIIGIGAAIISIYYTTIWLIEFLPWGFALMLSSIMVGFSISAFETVVLFSTGQVTKSRYIKIFITSGFILLWIIVSSFSIMSTVAGQYNKNVKNLVEQTKEGKGARKVSWNLLQEQKTELRKGLIEYREQIKILNNILLGMNTVESRNDNQTLWNETQWRITQANKEISKIMDELSEVRENEKILIEEGKKKGDLLSGEDSDVPDFYGWLAKIFEADKNKVQFIMSLFPAIFVDVISPVGIALALFLRQRYK